MNVGSPELRANYATGAIIEPGPQKLGGCVISQPSKNYTTRYLLAAALGGGQSRVGNVATSDDAAAMQRVLGVLGARVGIAARPGAAKITDAKVSGFPGGRPTLAQTGPINVGNAGAVLRLALGIGALLPEVSFITDRPDSLGKRPNGELLRALEQLGCASESKDGCLPITLHGGRLHGGNVHLSGAQSSQFVSSLLFLAPLIGEEVKINITDRLVSRAPVLQTIETMRAAGIDVANSELTHIRIDPQRYTARDYEVNGDWPGSAALMSAAAVTGSEITVRGLVQDQQGEVASLDALREMGADAHLDSSGATLRGTGQLRGIEFDGDRATDAVLALIGAACFAEGRSRFYNVSNLRIKECDRISEPIAELRKIGVLAWEGCQVGDEDPDAIIIEGEPRGYEGGLVVDGRRDHRVIMLLTIVGLGCRKGLAIREAEHVAKSYPLFFEHLRALGANIRLEPEAKCEAT